MENIEAMLCAYIEGDLDEAGRAQIEKHLQENPQHRKLIEELLATRDLVRGLPRVRAPSDVDESLRGQVERSILLDSAGDERAHRPRGGRWPQMLAMAAICLLCASLGLILYRALWPTTKPVAYTDNYVDRSGAVQTPPEAMREMAPSTRLTEPVDILTGKAPDALAYKALRGQISKDTDEKGIEGQSLAMATDVKKEMTVTPAAFDAASIWRRLRASGYAIPLPLATEGNHGVPLPLADSVGGTPVLLIVNSPQPVITNAQITDFLNNTAGVSWKLVPAEAEAIAPAKNNNGLLQVDTATASMRPDSTVLARATTQPVMQDEKRLGDGTLNVDGGISRGVGRDIPTTEPASDVYVASGMTAGEVEALRQTLMAAGNGAGCNAVVQSAAALATTQPAVNFGGGLYGNGPEPFTPAPMPAATQGSPGSNAAMMAGPATAPSNSVANGVEFGVAGEQLKTVDAVIVVQPARVGVLPEAVSGGAAARPVSGREIETGAAPSAASQPAASQP